VASLAPAYQPRRPHETALYRLVKEHGDEFLGHARDAYDGPLPRYVEKELRGYLRCGDFSRGFVHLQCANCKHDLLVAFSCKNRGLCPSCAGRRMAAQAAHLVDCVLPAVPIRQYVLSFPFELSALAATRPDVLRALARIHANALAAHYRAALKRAGHTGKVHPGSVTFVQRFGSSLNSHVHLHTCALDGAFVEREGALSFARGEPVTRGELYAIVGRVFLRVHAWLKKRGYLRTDAGDESNEAPRLTLEETLTNLAMGRGTVREIRDSGDEHEADEPMSAPIAKSDAVTHHGFNLHGSVTALADDDVGRERLARYGLRPPFSVARLSFQRDGMLRYRVKAVGRGRAKVRVMTPVEAMARLVALIPPPRYPLTRFYGVLAPRHRLRSRIASASSECARRCVS